MKHYGIIGAGGFGREVIPIARQGLRAEIERGEARLVFVVEGTPASESANGYPILSMDAFGKLGSDLYFNIAIADARARERIARACMASGMRPWDIRAENSLVLDGNDIAEGVILTPYSMVTSNSKIGRFFHANIYSYVAHDCIIGDFVTFAPGAKCNGNVVVRDYAYVGTGAIIKQGSAGNPIEIGEGAVIGMGAVVTKSVPAGAVVVGNPAKPMQK